DGIKFSRELDGWIFTTLPFGTGVYFALVGIEHSLAYMAQAREREAQAARLTAQVAEAQLGALRMQLNPHFPFNSLNAITVLVRDQNTAAASRMLELLTEVADYSSVVLSVVSGVRWRCEAGEKGRLIASAFPIRRLGLSR